MKIQVFPIEYRGEKRIGIRALGFDRVFPTLMKRIPGNRWTPDEKCWHIPYQKGAYKELKRLFGESNVIISPQGAMKKPAKRKYLSTNNMPVLIYHKEVIRLEEQLSNDQKITYRFNAALFLSYFVARSVT